MKKLICLFLSLCTMLIVFAGCHSEKPNGPATGDPSGTVESDVATTSAGDPGTVTKKYDGAVFTVIATPGKGSDNEVDFEATEVPLDSISQAIYKRSCATELELEVEIYSKYIYWEELPNYITTSDLSGGGDYDAICGRMETLAMMVTGGYFYNLSDIPSLDLTNDWWDQDLMESIVVYPNARFFAFGDINYGDDYAASVTVFNKTMCTNMGIDPYSFVDNNEWTIEKLKDTIKDLAVDRDNDGMGDQNDTYGYIANGGLLSAMLISSDVSLVSMQDGYPTLTSRSILVDKSENIFNWMVNNQNVLFVERQLGYAVGDTMFPNGKGYFTSSQVMDMIKLRASMSDPMGVLPYPKYSTDQKDYISPMSHMYMTGYAVPWHHADLEMTGTILDTMGRLSQTMLTPTVITSAIYYRGVADPTDYEMLQVALKQKRVDIGVLYNWAGLYDLTYHICHNNSFTMESALQSYTGDINIAIDKTVEAMRLAISRIE